MAQLQDIPRLVSEFTELAKEYLLQETVEPAKKLGHFAGYSIGDAVIWAIALVLLSVAGLRSLITLLPSGPHWESLGYMVASLILIGFLALIVKLVPNRGVHDASSRKEESGDPS